MSLSWLSSGMRIALLPGQAALAAGGRLQTEVRHQGSSGWNDAVTAMDTLLEQKKLSGRARVTLSHHFTRLFLLPPPATWLKTAEMGAWLQAQLDAPLGGAADWRFAWRPTPPGRPILVAAVLKEQAAELEQVLIRRGLALGGLQPWLSAAWDRRGRKLGGGDGWYALAEPGQLVLVRLVGGKPLALRQRQVAGDDAAADLAALLTREALLAGVEPCGRVWLERAGVDLDGAALGGAYRLEQLAGPREPAGALLS